MIRNKKQLNYYNNLNNKYNLYSTQIKSNNNNKKYANIINNKQQQHKW